MSSRWLCLRGTMACRITLGCVWQEIICVSDGNEEASIFEKELKAMHPKVQVIINKDLDFGK